MYRLQVRQLREMSRRMDMVQLAANNGITLLFAQSV